MAAVRGLISGFFSPLQQSYRNLIGFARRHADQLHIVIYQSPEDDIAIERRCEWLKEIGPEALITVLKVSRKEEHADILAESTRSALGFVPEVVFGFSANFESAWCRLGAEYKCPDNLLGQVIDEAALQDDPYRYWECLDPVVRAYYVRKIAFVGAESTGKTTIAQMLTKMAKTYMVPEYWRFYWEAKKFSSETPGWTTDEFVHVAQEQCRFEDIYSRQANRILFCDTNAFQVALWHRRYLEFYDEKISSLFKDRDYDLVFLCETDIPFVQDGVRDGEHIRQAMSQWLKDQLKTHNIPYHVLKGSLDERLQQAISLIQRRLPFAIFASS